MARQRSKTRRRELLRKRRVARQQQLDARRYAAANVVTSTLYCSSALCGVRTTAIYSIHDAVKFRADVTDGKYVCETCGSVLTDAPTPSHISHLASRIEVIESLDDVEVRQLLSNTGAQP